MAPLKSTSGEHEESNGSRSPQTAVPAIAHSIGGVCPASGMKIQ